MKGLNHKKVVGLLTGLVLGFTVGQASAAALSISKTPLSLATQVKPNIMIMLDNSGSMKSPLYSSIGFSERSDYDTSTVYSGMFQSTQNYKYDAAIPVDDTEFPGVFDKSKKGAFVEAACTPSSGDTTCWSGNFLNWLVTRRIDASRVVLVGGKLESRAGFAYNAYGNASAIEYKIVGNNEPRDNSNGNDLPIKAKYSASSQVSPIVDDTSIEIDSTAQSGAINTTTNLYDPYAKLKTTTGDYNVAVVVKTKPTGLLQDVADKVRLGISFYYFDPNADKIYNGNKQQGGTLKFYLPKNPFVNKPTDTSIPTAQRGYKTPVTGYVGTGIDAIVKAVEFVPLVWGTTPLAENLWEIIQYFEQDTPYYRADDFSKADATNPERDPYYFDGALQACVESRILIFTDGEPYRDAGIDPAQVDYDGDGSSSEVSNTSLSAPVQDGNDNLDDVAYWAYCNKSLATGGTCKSSGVAVTPTRDLRPLLAGNQYLKISAVGFADGNIKPILKDTADNAGGNVYAASDGQKLKNALNAIFNNTIAVSSAASVASNSTSLNTSSLIYQAQFDGADWSGQLRAFSISTTNGSISSTPTWDTDVVGFPAFGSRKVYSYNAAGIDFKFSAMSAAQKTSLQLPSESTDVEAKKRVTYILGDQSDEQVFNASGTLVSGIFRARKKLLGDIVHSSPWFVGADNFGYVTLPSTEGSSYASFLTTKATRTQMLYVGANDGMLHAFNAKTGSESFAYVPSELIPKLVKLTDPAYGKSLAHDYFVDGVQRAGDAYFGSSWHTVLVGSTGAGGRSVYALDVTDPDNFDETNVLWEFNDSNDVDMGYTLAEPTIARMANGKWAAIVPNGYNSSGDKAVLFIIDLETGAQIAKLDTKAGNSTTPNGLSSAIPVDTDGDHNVDAIYAGDLLGNLWKFDVSGAAAGSWKIAYGTSTAPEPLFIAKDSSGTRQPITAKPQAGLHPVSGTMIYFGTGQYFAVNDQIVGATPQVQSYYAIRDNFSSSVTTTPVVRTDLQQQSILAESSAGYRLTSNNTVNYASQKGWYMNLQPPSPTAAQGERVVSASLLRNNRIVFVTLIPNSTTCGSGGSSWLMEMDAVSGARLATPAFDLSADGKFDTSDNVAFFDTNGDGTIDGSDRKYVVAGKKLKGGASNTPTVVQDGDKEYKYTSGSKANAANNAIMDVTTESVTNGAGRESWRQIKIN